MYVQDNHTLLNLLSIFLSELKESNRSLSILTRGTDLFEYIQLIKSKTCFDEQELNSFFFPLKSLTESKKKHTLKS